MKSPFPGMDPYLEARWSDVHAALIILARESLQPKLPTGLRARGEERVLLEDANGEPLRQYRSDVALIETSRRDTGRAAESATAVAAPEPIVVQVYDGPEVDRFVQIVDVSNGNRVITAIEVLSPWNKAPGRLNEEYRRKLVDYERAGVSVVEIDLLRTPRGRLRITDMDLPANRRTPYMIAVQRASTWGRWEVYPVSLRQPIPPIRVPLRETDADVVLELQPLIERAYVGGGHDDIDYTRPPVPELSAEDEAWANELLRRAGRR